jgi:ketosteroid isomerase-like protein
MDCAVTRSPHDIARAFIAASEAGVFPDDLCAPDMTAWTTLQSEHDLAAYAQSIAWMHAATGGTLRFTIDHITATDDRAVIEARSTATLSNGSAYANTYVFALGITDGQISEVREHYNAHIVMKKLVPLMAASA